MYTSHFLVEHANLPHDDLLIAQLTEVICLYLFNIWIHYLHNLNLRELSCRQTTSITYQRYMGPRWKPYWFKIQKPIHIVPFLYCINLGSLHPHGCSRNVSQAFLQPLTSPITAFPKTKCVHLFISKLKILCIKTSLIAIQQWRS